ncbi:MAG: phosphoenolpyruvate--protein phosphotransferase [Kiritimatiellae bacterium]|nr:phosphoenolpyruvate--protein phosphotransferase [Kiritimatiellia bacterium]
MTAQKEIILKGIGVSPGVAVGPAHVLSTAEVQYIERPVDEDEIPREMTRFEDAIMATRAQLRELQEKVEQGLDRGKASIFDAHLLVCDDRSFIEDVLRGIRTRRLNVEPVLAGVSERYAAALARVEDEYLRERAADIRDVTRRIQMNLAGRNPSSLGALTEPSIILAADLSPSETAGMDRQKVLAFATDHGSTTSHTAIMARALELPAVVGLHDASIQLTQGERVLVDGTAGLVIIHPTNERIDGYTRIRRARAEVMDRLNGLRDEPARTRDGYEIELAANIELPHDVDSVLQHGAQGVGLFRTEFLFLRRTTLPSEEEQLRAYEEVARRLAPSPVVIRTLDIGGDKFSSALNMPREINPFLGCRAIRFSLNQPELFRAQLRAILRASVLGNVKLMYPMISHADELDQATRILDQVRMSLSREGVPFDEEMEVGCMIEVPSAALTARSLAQKVRFFSIGSNDLIQYTMAVDRVNENIAYLYEPTHPAILRLIRETISAARDEGIWTGICGEMAGHPLFTPLLLGLGVDELSVSPVRTPIIKGMVRSLKYADCEALAREALASDSGAQVLELCEKLTSATASDIVSLTR